MNIVGHRYLSLLRAALSVGGVMDPSSTVITLQTLEALATKFCKVTLKPGLWIT